MTGNGTDSAAVPVAVPASLTPKQRQFIQALLTDGDVAAACETASVGRSTAYRWMQEAAFAAALREAEREALLATSRRLVRLGGKAVQVLEDTLGDHEAPAAVRVRAADSVLTKLLQLRETVDLEERIAALEAAIAQGDT